MLVFLVEVEGDSTQKENEGKVYYILELPYMFACGGREVQSIMLCVSLSNWHGCYGNALHAFIIIFTLFLV